MALINCPKCGTEISDKASTCLKCGFPVSASASRVVLPSLLGQSTRPLQPAGNLINHAFSLYRSRTGTVLLLLLMQMVLLALAVDLPMRARLWPLALPLVFVVVVWGIASFLVVVRGVEDKIGAVECCKRAARKILSLAWTIVLQTLVIAVGLLLVVPGLIFSVWFSLSFVLPTAEGVSGSAALRRSKALVRGRWWPVLWRLVAIELVVGFLYIAAGVIPVALNAEWLSWLTSSAMLWLLMPVYARYFWLLYEDLRNTAVARGPVAA